jgi:DNA-binding XRE family transcriptional regulator
MRLGTVMRKWRMSSDRTLRDVAKQIGIHHTTLARLEKGQSCPVEALIKIGMWLIQMDEYKEEAAKIEDDKPKNDGIDSSGENGLATIITFDSIEDSSGKGQ